MKKILYYIILATAMLTGCINNDLPYPTIVAEITAFEVSDQLEAAKIDTEKREVTVQISENANIKTLAIKKFEFNNDAKVDPAIGTSIDLSTAQKFKLTTYQDYEWTIIGEQKIERHITSSSNQIGNAEFIFDPLNNKYEAKINVHISEDISNINLTSLKLGPSIATVTPSFEEIKDFTEPQTFTVSYYDITETWRVTVVELGSDVFTGEVNAWANMAMFNGVFATASLDTPSFEYKKEDATEWTLMPSSEITIDGGAFKGTAKGLEPNSTYLFRSVIGDAKATEKEFTTEAATQIPNMNFDIWNIFPTRNGLRKTWYAAIDKTAENYWWDSGNEGANFVADINPTKPEESIVVNGKAAKLSSSLVTIIGIKTFASASIFTGTFGAVSIAPMGATLNFGRAYTARPLQLKGHLRYQPGVIDYADAKKYPDFKGKQDTCSIYVMLTDWDAPFLVNTAKGIFFDAKTDPGVIAYGEMSVSRSMTAYEPFTIDIKYRDLNRKPKYIVLVAAASKYGDYFTGSTTSMLYIDELEFVFNSGEPAVEQ